MGTSFSKHKAQPFPNYPTAYQPFPQGPYPPGFPPNGSGFIPPGYGQHPPFPVPAQVGWPPQEKKRKKHGRRRSTDRRYPDSQAATAGGPSFTQPQVGRAPSRAASQRSQAPPRGRAPFVPPPNPVINPPGQNPPPLFTPHQTPLATFPSPQVDARNRRGNTPYVPTYPIDDDDDDDDDDEPVRPPFPGQAGGAASVQFQDQPREQPQADMRVIQPLGPANPSAFGPPRDRPRAAISNPLPPPPRDLYEMTPYKQLLNLPQTTALLTATYGSEGLSAPAGSVVPGTGTGTIKRKKSRKGLFRAFSTSRKEPAHEPANDPGLSNVRFVPVFVPGSVPGQEGQTPAGASAAPMNGTPAAVSVHQTGATPTHGPSDIPRSVTPAHSASPPVPTIRFDQRSAYSGFMNHSPHRVLYQNKTYPSATHLHEAMKYLDHRPDLADAIRLCHDVHEVYPLSARYQQFQRADWGQVFMKAMEDVLFIKFKQHPDLRSMLLGTGIARLIYEDPNDKFWGDGADGRGQNELGKALVVVRERLRAEGYVL